MILAHLLPHWRYGGVGEINNRSWSKNMHTSLTGDSETVLVRSVSRRLVLCLSSLCTWKVVTLINIPDLMLISSRLSEEMVLPADPSHLSAAVNAKCDYSPLSRASEQTGDDSLKLTLVIGWWILHYCYNYPRGRQIEAAYTRTITCCFKLRNISVI